MATIVRTPSDTWKEGFATACSIHMATGHSVCVAFDAPNLQPVAEAIRAKFPDALICIASDMDRWTVIPVNNPGLTAARKAARAVNGIMAAPEFADLDGRPTDFNDLHQREGAEAVAACIDAALRPVPEVEDVNAQESDDDCLEPPTASAG